MQEKAYNEVGQMYRYFLTWRHASVVAAVAAAYFAFSTAAALQDSRVAGWMLMATAGVLVVLWLFDVRTREQYRHVMEAGAALETAAGVAGFYSHINALHPDGYRARAWHRRLPLMKLLRFDVTHSGAITLLFLGLSLVLFVAGLTYLKGLRLS